MSYQESLNKLSELHHKNLDSLKLYSEQGDSIIELDQITDPYSIVFRIGSYKLWLKVTFQPSMAKGKYETFELSQETPFSDYKATQLYELDIDLQYGNTIFVKERQVRKKAAIGYNIEPISVLNDFGPDYVDALCSYFDTSERQPAYAIHSM